MAFHSRGLNPGASSSEPIMKQKFWKMMRVWKALEIFPSLPVVVNAGIAAYSLQEYAFKFTESLPVGLANNRSSFWYISYILPLIVLTESAPRGSKQRKSYKLGLKLELDNRQCRYCKQSREHRTSQASVPEARCLDIRCYLLCSTCCYSGMQVEMNCILSSAK